MDAAQWTDVSFLTRTRRWIERQLDGLEIAATGEIEQPHVVKWSTVLRVPTTAGPVFKANERVVPGLVELEVAVPRPEACLVVGLG